MNKHPESQREQPNSPMDRLAALREYLGKSASLTCMQQDWLNYMRPMITDEQFEQYDNRITTDIAANVEVASEYIRTLAAHGTPVQLRVGEHALPIYGLGYDPSRGYLAGVPLGGEEPTFLPLHDGVSTLQLSEVVRY